MPARWRGLGGSQLPSREVSGGQVDAQEWHQFPIPTDVAVHLLHSLNTNGMKVVLDYKIAGVNRLPEKVETGVMRLTNDNVAQFKH
jgi:hypothetical protein